MNSALIKGGVYKDHRGKLFYNNDFDATQIKRIYFIKNNDVTIFRDGKDMESNNAGSVS